MPGSGPPALPLGLLGRRILGPLLTGTIEPLGPVAGAGARPAEVLF
jgi:hypothetical protein